MGVPLGLMKGRGWPREKGLLCSQTAAPQKMRGMYNTLGLVQAKPCEIDTASDGQAEGLHAQGNLGDERRESCSRCPLALHSSPVAFIGLLPPACISSMLSLDMQVCAHLPAPLKDAARIAQLGDPVALRGRRGPSGGLEGTPPVNMRLKASICLLRQCKHMQSISISTVQWKAGYQCLGAKKQNATVHARDAQPGVSKSSTVVATHPDIHACCIATRPCLSMILKQSSLTCPAQEGCCVRQNRQS